LVKLYKWKEISIHIYLHTYILYVSIRLRMYIVNYILFNFKGYGFFKTRNIRILIGCVWKSIHNFAWTFIHIHTYIHTHIHTYMHTCICTYVYTCIHAYILVYMLQKSHYSRSIIYVKYVYIVLQIGKLMICSVDD